MATGYSEVEIGYDEYMSYHHDSKLLFLPERSNNGTAVHMDNKRKIAQGQHWISEDMLDRWRDQMRDKKLWHVYCLLLDIRGKDFGSPGW